MRIINNILCLWFLSSISIKSVTVDIISELHSARTLCLRELNSRYHCLIVFQIECHLVDRFNLPKCQVSSGGSGDVVKLNILIYKMSQISFYGLALMMTAPSTISSF